METHSANYFAIAVGAVLAMAIGAIRYGPLFGKKWLEIVGVNPADIEARKKMQQGGYQLTIFIIYGLLLHFWK